jgi:hypothetical protein
MLTVISSTREHNISILMRSLHRAGSDVMKSATRLAILAILLSNTTVSVGRQAPIVQPNQTPPTTQKESYQSEFFRLAVNGAIFIYHSPSVVDPCAPLPPGTIVLLPLGTGFVAGIESTISTPKLWNGWKFLVTAKHVLANQSEVIVRVNSSDGSKFICKTLEIHFSGKDANVVFAPDGVDLVALWLPEIDGADPTVVPPKMLIDKSQMKEWNIGVGTQVATVGYLFGYSGQKANFPVTKFGHVAAMTDDAWFYNGATRLSEQGYVVDLSNAPGLSGAPVFAYGIEFETDPLRYRVLPPYLIGVVKDLLLAPVQGQMISQGVAVIEPAPNLKALMKQIAGQLKTGGRNVQDVN